MFKRITPLFILLVSFLVSCDKPSTPSKDFTFKGKPIDPFCIEALVDAFDKEKNPHPSLDLAKFERNPSKVITNEDWGADITKTLSQNGFIGYNYNNRTESGESFRATFYYKYLGSLKNNDVLLTDSIQGNAVLTSILLVKREGDSLQLASAPEFQTSGAFGGIKDAEIKGGKLVYTIYLTPLAFINLSGTDLKSDRNNNDLPDCHACSFAEVTYEQDGQTKKLISVDLPKELEWNFLNSSKYGKCLGELTQTYAQRGDTHLTPEKLKKLYEEFNKKCLKSEGKN